MLMDSIEKKRALLHSFNAACGSGNIETIHSMFKEGFQDIDQSIYTKGETPLFIASQKGHLEIVQLLLTEGKANVHKATVNGETPLFVACKEGRLEIVRFLLLEGKAKVDRATILGATPLFISCQEGHVEIARFLLMEGKANVEKAIRSSSCTPLLIACHKGHLDIVQILLIEGKANVETNASMTPLSLACAKQHLKIIRLLLKEGKSTLAYPRDIFMKGEVLDLLLSNPFLSLEQLETLDHSHLSTAAGQVKTYRLFTTRRTRLHTQLCLSLLPDLVNIVEGYLLMSRMSQKTLKRKKMSGGERASQNTTKKCATKQN